MMKVGPKQRLVPTGDTSLTVRRSSEDVSTTEFESVPRNTRGRLTLPQINSSLAFVRQCVSNKKQKVRRVIRKRLLLILLPFSKFVLPRSKMNSQTLAEYDEYLSKRVPEHKKYFFLTEAEIRSSCIFEVFQKDESRYLTFSLMCYLSFPFHSTANQQDALFCKHCDR
jgi:hypothetical protein